MRSTVLRIVLALIVMGGMAAVVWLYMASPPLQNVTLDDLTQPAEVVLKAPEGVTAVVGLQVIGSGQVDGDARIELVLNGRVHETFLIGGPVNIQWYGDWYSPEVHVRYAPAAAKDGSVKLGFRFSSL
jgi:hypothetical protein